MVADTERIECSEEVRRKTELVQFDPSPEACRDCRALAHYSASHYRLWRSATHMVRTGTDCIADSRDMHPNHSWRQAVPGLEPRHWPCQWTHRAGRALLRLPDYQRYNDYAGYRLILSKYHDGYRHQRTLCAQREGGFREE